MKPELRTAINQLADEYRERCLWFFAPGFRVEGESERDELQAHLVLDAVERYGDRAAFLRCRELRECLSPAIKPKS
jgi:hypothetical protein